MRQVLNIISCGDAKATDKVLGGVLQVSVTIVHWRKVILGPAEVSVARDRGRAVEFCEALLGLSLGVGIEAITSKEFVRRDTLLGTESRLGLRKFRLFRIFLAIFPLQ